MSEQNEFIRFFNWTLKVQNAIFFIHPLSLEKLLSITQGKKHLFMFVLFKIAFHLTFVLYAYNTNLPFK